MKIKVIALVLVAVAIGLVLAKYTTNDLVLTSPVGTTFSNAKIAAINMSLSSTSGTSTSVYNSDASDRFVESSFSYCTGVSATASGSTVLGFTAATTSTNAPATSANTNYVMNVTVGTTTAVRTNATSTFPSPTFQLWPAGSYITFFATATNTAACTVGVHYIGS